MSAGDFDTGIPLPRPTALSKPFWDGCRAGRLLVQRCADCGAYVFIPQPCCTRCQCGQLDWVESSGEGSVYSVTVVHRAPRPQFSTPYAVAVIELSEGWYMLSNVVDCAPSSVRVGMRVRVSFREVRDGVVLPYFVAAA